MKLLTRIKIINWHYFWDELIDIKPIVFLTGVNGSGKSTLIDAIQVVLLGDTSGRYFNKAAMDKSARTLKGYLRGELGDTVDGGFKYLRNTRFTSYIALEFFDDVNQIPFTMAIVFDSFEDGSEEHHFFYLENAIPINNFVKDRVPMDYKTLLQFFNENYPSKFQFFDSNRQYQDFLKRKFGGLKDKYFSLLKKATSFTPITDITTFITDYVCDPQANIELDALQDNILQYKKLEVEATNIEKEIRTKVEEFNKTVDEYSKNNTEYTNKNNELAALEAKLGAGYTEQMKADATLTLKVGENIQNDFIKALANANVYKPGSTTDKIFDLNSLDDSKVKTENLTPYETTNIVKYYTLIGDFTITADKSIVTATPDETNNTSYKLNSTISSIRGQVYSKIKTLLGTPTPTDLTNFEKEYQEVITTLKDKENYLKIAEDNYKKVSDEYYKEETGTLAKYLDAKSAYMYDATKTYYTVVEEYYTSISSGTPTDDQKNQLVTLLKEYGKRREALDGFVHKTGENKTYEGLTKDNVISSYSDVLGSSTLLDTNEESPYAKALKASEEMFGGTSIVLENPDVATEYRYKEANNGTARYTTDGLFVKYLTAYEAVQKIKMLEEYVALDNALTARSNELLAKVFEFKSKDDAIASNAEVIALETEIKDLLDKLELGHADILLTSGNTWDPDNIDNAPGKLTVERATANETGNNYSLDNIEIYQGSSTSDITALGGYLGAHILNLKAYFNNLNSQNNTYTNELEDMEDLLAYEQSQLAAAKQDLAQFDAGGYEMTTGAPGSIKIGDGATSYFEVKIYDSGLSTEYKLIRYYLWNPITNVYDLISITRIEITDPSYYLVGGGSTTGPNITFTPTTNYLKAIIEAYEAQKDILDAQIKDLDATYEILIKERDQFMSTINSLYQ